MPRRHPRRLAAALTLAFALLPAAAAHATFRGSNGKLSFSVQQLDQLRLQTIDPGGGTPATLPLPVNESASWAPGGDRLAGHEHTSLATLIFVEDAAGRQLAEADGPGGGFGGAPMWSHDGTRLAYTWNERHPVDRDGLVVVRSADGSGDPVVVAEAPADRFNFDLAWAPRDRRLAVLRCDGDTTNCDVLVTRADGTGTPRRIATGATAGLDWSAADGLIAFTRGGDAWVSTPGGHLQWRVACDASVLSFSPDGRRLLVQRDGMLFTVRATGGHLRQVTADGTVVDEAVWSPDSREIAFLAKPSSDGVDQVNVIRADGTGLRTLTGYSNDQIETFVSGLDWQARPATDAARRHHRAPRRR